MVTFVIPASASPHENNYYLFTNKPPLRGSQIMEARLTYFLHHRDQDRLHYNGRRSGHMFTALPIPQDITATCREVSLSLQFLQQEKRTSGNNQYHLLPNFGPLCGSF